MKTSKIYIILFVGFSLIASFVNAGDCGFVDSIQQKDAIPKYMIVFPQDVFSRAIENLRAYCCEKYSDELSVCKSAGSVKDYPKSEFLFDHLLDIAFRRLDGTTGNYVYNLNSDLMGESWRTFMNKVSLSITGDMSAKISEEYNKYWKLKYYEYNYDLFLDYNNLEKISLSDKYYLTCDVLKDMINNNFGGVISQVSDEDVKLCRNLAYNRISRESLLFRNVLVSSSNQLLKSTFNAYLIDYYLQNKLSAFKDKLVEFTSMFYTIFKQAPVSKTCSK